MESGITRERVGGSEWVCHHWGQERQCFQKNTGSTKSNTGQGLGTLDESATRAIFGAFHPGIRIQIGKTRKRVEGGRRGWCRWKVEQ